MSAPYRHPQAPIATPGNSLEKVLYQDSNGLAPDVTLAPRQQIGSPYTAVVVAFKCDQAMTFLQKWGPCSQTTDANMVTINGTAAAGETAAANTFFSRLVWLQPGRNRISILAGVTGPTATTVAVELYSGPMPFQGVV
jgi:hypothetical protein